MSAPLASSEMSNAAFAGFLRLLLTPLHEAPKPSRELGAYLDFLNRTQQPAGAAPKKG